MKETKIKTSLLSLTPEPGNKTLVRSVIFFFIIIRENKNSKQKMGGIYTVTSTLITAVTNTRSFRSSEWSWSGNA